MIELLERAAANGGWPQVEVKCKKDVDKGIDGRTVGVPMKHH